MAEGAGTRENYTPDDMNPTSPPEDIEHAVDRHEADLERQAKDIAALTKTVAGLREGLADVARICAIIPALYGNGGANMNDGKNKLFQELNTIISELSIRYPKALPQ